MLIINTDPGTPRETRSNHSLSSFIVPAVFVLITVTVFITQSGGVGFWKGSHGWNSAHGLAIMTHATPQNLFVGHALMDRGAGGHTGYIYFDRYPFFFSASMNALMSLSDDLSVKVWLARQAMNGIFVATLLAAYLLVRRWVRSGLLALAITLLAFASYNLLYYRDMIHYDQPALLGMLILLNLIAAYKSRNRHRWRWLYAGALIAVSLGRGYASFFILGPWAAAEAAGVLREHGLSLGQRIRKIMTHDATRVLFLALIWTVLLLSYNIVIEAQRTGVPIQNTSVVSSALRRLPVDYDAEDLNPDVISARSERTWGEFLALEAERYIRWFTPLHLGWDDGEISPWAIPGALLALAVITLFVVRQPPRERLLLFLTAYSGPLWVIFMINLTAAHEFTTMYGIGFALIFYLALLRWLERYRLTHGVMLAVCLGLFIFWSDRVYVENVDEIRSYDVYTQDYNRILHAIAGTGKNIYHTFPNNCAIENSKCYVLGFYLGSNYMTPDYSIADYVLTGYQYFTTKPFLEPGDDDGVLLLSHTLTPDNTVAFLFDTTSAEVRHIPPDAQTLFNFGDTFALQKWELKDSVEVQPCQRVSLESWWQMIEQPQHNDSMQIALVDSGGQAVSSSNAPLTWLPTRDWIPGAYFLDARPITIPCDAPAGEYPLVMSIYNPDTVADTGALPVSLPDGTPSNDYLYLTTLSVR